ncbi:Coadhesin [Lamellibrachia satsuma]|nr:Coadhesin [Lamellibrachia satsuma]
MEWTWTTEKPVKRVFPSLYTWADVFGPRLHRFPGRPAVFQSADPSDGSESTSEDDKDRPRVSEPTRLILHIVAVVVVIAAVIGVVLAIVYGLPKRDNEDTITTTTKPTAYSTLRVDGQWSDWDPWSGCTKTCGSGTKSRNRLCNDPEPLNGGSNCTGKSEETVDCATWSCPDCSKQCPAGGTLSQDCSVCECNVSPINGRVVYIYNSTTLPLDDVKVYVVGHEWKPWTSTDRTGRFSIEGLCWNDTKLFFLDDDYLTEVTEYAVPGSGNITVEMVKKGRFIDTIRYLV